MIVRPLAFTYPYFIVFWGLWLWGFWREMIIVSRGAKADRQGAPDDRGSLNVVMLSQGIGGITAFWLAWQHRWLFPDPNAAFWIGLALFVAGAVLRRLCFRALGQWFTGEVRVRADQQVITTGPYRLVRHPSYTAGIMVNTGIAIALGSWLGSAIMFVLATLGYSYRIMVEERALAVQLGEPYREYIARTKRFIPYVV